MQQNRLLPLAAVAVSLLSIHLGMATAMAHHDRGSHRWKTVSDTTPPETTITAGPTGTISSSSVSFSFGSSESPSTFECRLDASSWATCSSPKSYSALSSGGRTFEVRAKDAAGNLDASPAAASFTVQTESPAADPGAKATTRPVGSPPLSDAEAAARVNRNGFEPRGRDLPAGSRDAYYGGSMPNTTNYPMNETVLTQAQIDAFLAHPENAWAAKRNITGNFTGTTDEIIQWAAHKHGLDEDLMRAVAAAETWWRQGDGSWTNPDGTPTEQGGGIFAMTWVPNTFPAFAKSTAAAADYFAASMRYYYDGEGTWLNDVERGAQYAMGDLWGTIGAWYAGRWRTPAAESYILHVKDYLQRRVWEQPGF